MRPDLPDADPPATVTSPALPGLDVGPTPDDGQRVSQGRAWDEATRPEPLPPVAGAAYPASGRRDAAALVSIHDHLRAELEQLRDLVDQVAAGHRGPGEARSLIATMTLRQNSWTLGTYCETYCRVVSVHHTIEDEGWFPRLRAAEVALEPVIDRLTEEHVAIAGILDRVDVQYCWRQYPSLVQRQPGRR